MAASAGVGPSSCSCKSKFLIIPSRTGLITHLAGHVAVKMGGGDVDSPEVTEDVPTVIVDVVVLDVEYRGTSVTSAVLHWTSHPVYNVHCIVG